MAEQQDTCLVCHEAITIFAIGKCDHPICFKCCTRMRALCDQMYCPSCRQDQPEVFLMNKVGKYEDISKKRCLSNRRLNIMFENSDIRDKFEEVIECRCKICKDAFPEKSFKALRDHMRKQHTLFYCDLCCDSLKIFPSERKVYNRKDLATHKRLGDKDDTSYKGHPLCEFCDERYLDTDELYKHLRKDHYYCHFCEADRSQEYFSEYDILREHFRTEHYLCEEGDCINRQFENAFRSEIDIKGHRTQFHGKSMSKHQAKQERTLNIDINLAPRPKPRGRGAAGRDDYEETRRGPRYHGSDGHRGGRSDNREQRDLDRAVQASLSTMKEEKPKKPTEKELAPTKPKFVNSDDNFPTLGDVPAAPKVSVSQSSENQLTENRSSLANVFAMSNNMTVQHGGLGIGDFPSLSGGRSASPNLLAKSTPPTSGRNSPFVNPPVIKEDPFPQLRTSGKPGVETTKASWVQQNGHSAPSARSGSGVSGKKDIKQKPTKSAKSEPKGRVVNIDNDFPSLGQPSRESAISTWFKSSNDNNTSSKPIVSQPVYQVVEEKTSNSHPYSIIDRFSPVNVVSDAPRDEHGKSKNQKKKKKDKETVNKEASKPKENVSNTKNKKANPSPGLRGNSSLDNIANMLLPSATSDNSSSAATKKQRQPRVGRPQDIPQTTIMVPLSVPESVTTTTKGTPNEAKKPEQQKVKFTIEDEFPSLSSNKKGEKTPPPGFVKGSTPQQASKPPPGFTADNTAPSKRLPPGFSAVSTAPDATTQSKPGMPMSVDLANFKYAPTEDFLHRNQQLIGHVQAVLKDDQFKFQDFKKLSGEFRRKEIDAEQYYSRCEEIIGKENFANIFPELLALLPDINKQQELYSVYAGKQQGKKNDKKESVLKIGNKYGSKSGAWKESDTGFLSCQTCKQVLLRKDYTKHISSHTLDTAEFPSLHTTVTMPPSFGLSTWVKT